MVEELFIKHPRMLTYNWSKSRGTEPLVVNITNLLKLYNFPHTRIPSVSLTSLIPPRFDIANCCFSILGAELFAIFQSLVYIDANIEENIIIYSDSLSGLELIKNHLPKNYITMVLDIHNLLKKLNQNKRCFVSIYQVTLG